MKKYLIFVILFILAVSIDGKANQVSTWQKEAEDRNLVRIINAKDISDRKVTGALNGGGNLVIEEVYGVAIDDAGNGIIMNTKAEGMDAYIAYDACNIRKGDVVLSVLIYTPDRIGIKDYEARYDFIIDYNYEV